MISLFEEIVSRAIGGSQSGDRGAVVKGGRWGEWRAGEPATIYQFGKKNKNFETVIHRSRQNRELTEKSIH
jgi:hypothetical protein